MGKGGLGVFKGHRIVCGYSVRINTGGNKLYQHITRFYLGLPCIGVYFFLARSAQSRAAMLQEAVTRCRRLMPDFTREIGQLTQKIRRKIPTAPSGPSATVEIERERGRDQYKNQTTEPVPPPVQPSRSTQPHLLVPR